MSESQAQRAEFDERFSAYPYSEWTYGERAAAFCAWQAARKSAAQEPVAFIYADDLRRLKRNGAATVYEKPQTFRLTQKQEETALYAESAAQVEREPGRDGQCEVCSGTGYRLASSQPQAGAQPDDGKDWSAVRALLQEFISAVHPTLGYEEVSAIMDAYAHQICQARAGLHSAQPAGCKHQKIAHGWMNSDGSSGFKCDECGFESTRPPIAAAPGNSAEG